MNVVVENSTDRVWQDRKYMRVDWSENLANSLMNREQLISKFFGGGRFSSVKWEPSDLYGEDSLHFEPKEGYLDFTNRFTVEQELVDLGWGKLPSCHLEGIFSGANTFDCSEQESKVRYSFARVDAADDFESLQDDVAWNEIVGNPGGDGSGLSVGGQTAPRSVYDPGYDVTDASTHRLKNIHNLWEKSHQAVACSENVDGDGNGTADACEAAVTGWKGHGGSRCDVLVGKCTIPVRDRKLRTVAYTMNKEAPPEYQDAVDESGKRTEETRGTLEQIPEAWNQLLEVAIAYRREAECRRTKDGDRDACHSAYFASGAAPSDKPMLGEGAWLLDTVKPQAVDEGRKVLDVCHNPARSYDDPRLCGAPGTAARFGDLRRHFLVYWPYRTAAPYGGIVARAADPTSGQILGTSATIMGRSATRAAAYQRDLIQLALGDVKAEDFLDGAQAARFAATLTDPQGSPLARLPETDTADALLADAKSGALRQRLGATPHIVDASLGGALSAAREKTATQLDFDQFLKEDQAFSALAAPIAASPVGAQFSAGHAPANQSSAANSLLGNLDPARLAFAKDWYASRLHARGVCTQDTESPLGNIDTAALAPYFKAKYGSLSAEERGKRIYEDLVKESIKGIGLHEFGHSMGLYHNFASSWDAPNYAPQYWQLRTDEGQAAGACTSARSGSKDSCLGPRWLDPATADEMGRGDEARPSIDYFANTSTMEYPGGRFFETRGLGTYDLFAMKALYGRVLETIDDRVIPAKDQTPFKFRTWTHRLERDIVGNNFSHYTDVARALKVFDPIRDCRPATDAEKARGTWRIVHGKVCAPPPHDHAAWEDFTSGPLQGTDFYATSWKVKQDGKTLLRWPYRFGQQYGASGYVHVHAGDLGADVYELVGHMNEQFAAGYINYFRRGQTAPPYSSFLAPIGGGEFHKAQTLHWQVAQTLGRATPAEIDADPQLKGYALAETELVRFLVAGAFAPEPGNYAATANVTPPGGTTPVFDVSTGGSNVAVSAPDGRFIQVEFDDTKGGSWDYTNFPKHYEYEREKVLALASLFDARPSLSTVARETALDGRALRISFRSSMPAVVDDILASALAEDWDLVGPAWDNPSKSVVYPLPGTNENAGAPRLFGNFGYRQQVPAAIYANLFARYAEDRGLLASLRIYGDGEAISRFPDAEARKFTDPTTGTTYVARALGSRVRNGRAVENGIGARVLSHANALLIDAYEVDRGADGTVVLDAFGRATPKKAADGALLPRGTSADATMRVQRYADYLGVVDAVVLAARAGREGGWNSSDE